MNITLQKLEAWGCDITGALPRFLEDEEFMLECIRQVAEDPAFGALEAALRSGELQQAFDAAHTLKGIMANTGLTKLYEIVVKIVEPLRRGEWTGLTPQFEELCRARQELCRLLAE